MHYVRYKVEEIIRVRTTRQRRTKGSPVISRAARFASIALGIFFLAAGFNKFGSSGVVFRYLEYNSGFDWIHPIGQRATGVVELIAGVLLSTKRTRLSGASIAASTMLAALGFHLSPWLGVAIPTELTEGAVAPWSAEDFSVTTTAATFNLAVIALAVSVGLIYFDVRDRRSSSPSSLIDE